MKRASSGRVGAVRAGLGRIRELFPFTLAGLVAAAAAVVAVSHYGLARLDLVLLAAGVVILTLVAVSTLVVAIAAFVVWRAVRRQLIDGSLTAECGYFVPTGFTVPALRWLPFADVRWTLVAPEAEVRTVLRDGRLVEEVRANRRDHFSEVIRRIEVRESFGFAAIAFRARERRGGRFSPWVGNLDSIPLIHGLAGGGDLTHPEGKPTGDLYDTRRYSAGDPIRFILWKVFAKTRELLVRAPENALAPSRRTLAYMVAGDGDEAAAGAARIAVTRGALGTEWLLGVDGSLESASSAGEALDLLARSARARPDDRGALAGFLQRAGRTPGTRAVVFVPPRPGPWLDKVAAAARGRGQATQIEFVVCTDGIAAAGARSRWARAALRAADAPVLAPASQAEVGAVVDALRATGANVLIVDRPGGRLFSGRAVRGEAA